MNDLVKSVAAPKVGFASLGCPKALTDSELILTQLSAEGYQTSKTFEGADLVIVNTCGFIDDAVKESLDTIAEALSENGKVIVTGCLGAKNADDGQNLVSSIHPSVLAVTGPHATNEVMDAVHKYLPKPHDPFTDLIPPQGIKLTPKHFAYLKISEGCNHRCTFCIIPFGRGNSRSVPAGVVVDQVKRLVDRGYAEIVLTGVDMTSWGADLPATPRLGDLVLRILKLVPDLPRLRISSIDSIEVDPALMQAIATEPRLMPHLHLSLQHGDDLILKRMKRRHLRDDAIRFTEEALRLRPEMTFGADIIAGFPTETEAHFENSLALVRDCNLTWLHVFPYSVRNGTPAARMPQVNGRAIKDRAARLRQAGERQVARHLAAQIGQTHSVLMERPTMGRTQQFAEVTFDHAQQEGQIISAEITSTSGTQLHGRAA